MHRAFGGSRLAALIAAGLVIATSCSPGKSRNATFVGSSSCASCHASEFNAWRPSQHAAAMQHATPSATLGRFENTRFANGSATYTFLRRGDSSFVNATGPDGARRDYPVRYTFGVWPLQQYLVELSKGRLQALPIAWDTRPEAQGGQRWFSLAPAPEPPPGDPFHWTGYQYNWNYMCADCHSTDVSKGYVAAADSFDTKFSEVSVGCEACHGPGSAHLSWARYPSWLRRFWHDDGLPAQLTERRGVHWSIDSTTGNGKRSAPRTTDREIETCAQCHGRRSHIADGYTAGRPLLDYYAPLTIAPGLYHPDGQQLDEVYNYASFLQSKMYSKGVTCSDCHDPHTQKLRAPGNAVCAQCHRPATYDTSAHHFHRAGSEGAQCAACHMPDTNYMQIDARRDHSIRIPRPDLSVALGVPNACNRCHTNQNAPWAAAAIRGWYPNPNPGFQRFAHAFAADDRNAPAATDSLVMIATDSTQPWIVRASALSRLATRPSPNAIAVAKASSHDTIPLVRLSSLDALGGANEADRLTIAVPLLTDPRRAVRQQAAWILAPVHASVPASARDAFDAASRELIESHLYNADRAPSRIRLAAFYTALGRYDDAAIQIRATERLDPATAKHFEQNLAAAAAADAQAAALLRALNSAR